MEPKFCNINDGLNMHLRSHNSVTFLLTCIHCMSHVLASSIISKFDFHIIIILMF